MNDYFVLTDSSGSYSYRFKAMEYNPIREKAQTENETIGGLDVAMGTIHEVYEYTVKLRENRWIINSSGSYRVEEDIFGTLENLEYFYALNNPNGTPTNVITLLDHRNATKSVYFIGQLALKPVTTIIEGGDAIYFIPIRLRVIPS